MQKTFNNIKSNFLKGFDKISSFKAINLVYVSIFIVVIVVFWGKLVALFKPSPDSKNQASKLTNVNNNSLSYRRYDPKDGHFFNGDGKKSIYTITQARENAERLSALLNTYKGAKWYSITLSFFGMGSIARIKSILNPAYPANYRRYVAEAYRDVYTDFRSLQTDVQNQFTGFAGTNYWDNNLTKYFTF